MWRPILCPSPAHAHAVGRYSAYPPGFFPPLLVASHQSIILMIHSGAQTGDCSPSFFRRLSSLFQWSKLPPLPPTYVFCYFISRITFPKLCPRYHGPDVPHWQPQGRLRHINYLEFMHALARRFQVNIMYVSTSCGVSASAFETFSREISPIWC